MEPKDYTMKKLYLFAFAAVVPLTAELALAGNSEKTRDESAALARPLVRKHFSTDKRGAGDGDPQAIARETADSIEVNIKEPVMTPTRSTFLAKWQAVRGATGYRLDVSTSPLFDSFVGNYRDLDLGKVTNQIVSGVEPGMRYYY